MRVTDTLCDRCGRGNSTEFGFRIGSQTDAAGSSEDKTLDADLCMPCRSVLFESLIRLIDDIPFVERWLRNITPLPTGTKSRPVFTQHP